jgi:heme-degrading monooxygenase HmoA
MFVVIFEVRPKRARWDDYLTYAKTLKPELEKIVGFIDNERFGSKRREGWLLSLSTWRDEKALIRWRTHGLHHAVQEKGRFEVFEDYHLRVGEIVADSQLPAGAALLQQRFDVTVAGAATLITMSEGRALDGEALDAKPGGLVEADLFESIYAPGKFLLLRSWRDAQAADSAGPAGNGIDRDRRVRVIRDYGMFDRVEAPQYYGPVERRNG